jgi:hypothetical protein
VEDLQRLEARAREVVTTISGFSSFGTVEQAEKKAWNLVDLKEAGIDFEALLQLDDSVAAARRGVLTAITLGGLVLILLLNPPALVVNLLGGSIIAGALLDNLVNSGAFQSLVAESIASSTNSEYDNRVVQHEAARFLVGYLIGVLPKAYSVSTSEALDKYESTQIKPGCAFCAAEFDLELKAGKVSSKTIDQFLCVNLAGIVQEYTMFGKVQSGAPNLVSVEDLLQAVGLNPRAQQEITRWAIYNVAQILKRHKDIHAELAMAMSKGTSTEECIALIERRLPLMEAAAAA